MHPRHLFMYLVEARASPVEKSESAQEPAVLHRVATTTLERYDVESAGTELEFRLRDLMLDRGVYDLVNPQQFRHGRARIAQG